MRISLGLPDEDEEVEVLRRVEAWGGGEPEVRPVLDARRLLHLQQLARRVQVHPDLRRYIVRLVHATRRDERVLLGASPRGAIGLQAAAKAGALFAGRGHATDDDVKDAAAAVLCHRIILRPDAAARGATAHQVVRTALATVPTPPVPPALAGARR